MARLSSPSGTSSDSTPSSQIEIRVLEFLLSRNIFDLSPEMFILGPDMIRPQDFLYSPPATSSSTISRSIGGSLRESITRKRSRRKNRGRKTTITSTISDISCSLLTDYLRWTTIRWLLMPSRNLWTSILWPPARMPSEEGQELPSLQPS